MLSGVGNGRVMISLIDRVEILVSAWVQNKVGSIEALGEWQIVVIHGVRVKELASVVGVVSRVLKPQWQPVFVVAF